MRDGPDSVEIMASMLTADFAALGEQCRALERAGIDGIHWDLMDGFAVPSLSFGPDVIAACRRCVSMPFEAHVMTKAPDRLVDQLAEAGCRAVAIHPDWVQNPRRTLQAIVDRGMTAGVALSPGAPVELARWHLDIVDLVVVMTVEPGFGGQTCIAAMMQKVQEVADLVRAHGRPIEIEVDGGIDDATIGAARAAGARRFVVGSALWRAPSFPAAASQLSDAIAGTTPMPQP